MDKDINDKNWELVVSKLYNSLNEKEQAEFHKLQNSKEGSEAIKQAARIYDKTSNAFLIQSIDKEKKWKDILTQTKKRISLKPLLLQISRYAAVFLLALLIGIIVPKFIKICETEVAYNKIEVDWGQMSKITLSDGTKVWLNAGTILEYPTTFNSKNRQVNINGEAFFKVTRNDKAPFYVLTKSGKVKVYGTSFNVSAYDDDPELAITLIEGKVAVENSNGKFLVMLKPNEQLVLNKQTGKAILRQVNTAYYNSWVEGKILLEDTKLSELAIILKRWYNVDITIVDEGLGDIQISGTILKGKSLDLFLKVLSKMYGIRYELNVKLDKKDEVIIYKN